MAAQRHIVQRQIIELRAGDQATAQRFQAAASRLFRQQIMPLIDQHCTELSDSDRIHRIESLEIDLGTIDPERFEQDFSAKCNVAIRRALADQINRQEQVTTRHDPDEPGPKSRSQLELLAFFARTGSLPWWADGHQPHILEECLEYLLQTVPTALRRLLQELARQPATLRRIVNHYPDELLARLTAVLAPGLEPVISNDAPALMALIQQSKAAANRQPARFRQLFWIVLFQIAVGSSPAQTPEEFFQAVLVRLAIELDTTYAVFLPAIQYKAQQDSRFSSTMRAMLDSEAERLGTEQTQRKAQEATEFDTLARLLERLAATRSESTALKTMLQDIIGQLPESARAKLLTALANLAVLDSLDELLRQLHFLLEPELSATELSRLVQFIRQEERLRLSPVIAEDTSIDLSFSEADALYIDNAGLVILWPFVGHFFTRLGLLAENRFKDFAARQRAVGLLQYLVATEDSFLEYRLPLNKILCGLDLTQVFEFGPPLTPAEREECDALLAAVISQAPILHDMSVAGFRGTFLLRTGALSSRDGAWLLRVERETYDIVLDRFPWGWEWIKLPWMAAPLRVEWSS